MADREQDHQPAAVDPSVIQTKQDLAEQLTALRRLAGDPSFDSLARMAFPGSTGRSNATTVRNWFTGAHAPRDSDAMQRVVLELTKRARLTDPAEVTRGFADAYDRIADARLRQRQARVPGARPAPTPVAVAGPVSAPGPVAEPEVPVRRPRRWRLVLAVAAVAAASGGVGFAAMRYSFPPPSVLSFPACAETIGTGHSSGYHVLTAETGPPGNPHPDRRIELRIQRDTNNDWMAYAYLTQTPTALDRVWLKWSYQKGSQLPQDSRECEATVINKVKQTPGVLGRDPNGWPRWFQACAEVGVEYQVPGRGRTICTSWTRPDS